MTRPSLGHVASDRTSLAKALVAPAGEHYVLYRLHALGMMATHAPRNAPTVDIVVMNPDEKVIATVQVKTRTRGSDGGWHMNLKHERMIEQRLFYAFVDLEPEHPVTYVVPSQVVADVLAKSHAAWLAAPGARGRPHRDNPMRRVLPAYLEPVPDYPRGWLEAWKGRWDLLA